MNRYLPAFVVAALFGAITGHAQTTNPITNIKFAEKLSRNVKFHHNGPIIGDSTEFDDKGVFNLQMTVSLEGVDITQITRNAVYGLAVEDTAGTEFSLLGALSDNPNYQTGDTKNKIVYTETFEGKDVKVGTVAMRVNEALGILTIKLKGVFLRTLNDGSITGQAGVPVIADNHLGEDTGTFTDAGTISFIMSDGSLSFQASDVLAIGGQVKSKDVTDSELGTETESKVGVVGTSP